MSEEHADLSQMDLSSSQDRRRRRWPTKMLLVAILGLGAVWITYFLQARSARRQTWQQFHRVALALWDQRDLGQDHLPYPVVRDLEGQGFHWDPRKVKNTGAPLCSWRADLIPSLQCWAGVRDETQPWNSPVNDEARKWFAPFFSYSSYALSREPDAETNILAVTGPGTAWGDGEEKPKSLIEIPSATILAVEVRSSGIPWMKPGDFDIRTMPQTINAPDGKGISSRHAGGFHVIFADGEVWFLSDKVPFAALRKFFTLAEAAHADREKEIGPYVLDRWLAPFPRPQGQ